MTRELESHMFCPPPVVSLLTAFALGTSGCDRDVPLAAEPQPPQAVQQSRDSALAPNADTYLRQGSPNQNQGTELILRLQASGKNRALVRWDPQATAGAMGGDSLVAARLELTITVNADNWGATGRTIDLHRLTQAWTELGATWNCADDANPGNSAADCSGATAWAMDGPDPRPWATVPTATRLITNGLRGVVTLDVTADVRPLSLGGGAQHGWILKKTAEGASGHVEFGSRESGSAPRLVLTVVEADTSPPPIPAALTYPRDTTRLVQEPGDSVVIYYRTLALVYFDDSTSGATIRAFMAKYGATIVGGEAFANGYVLQFPDVGPSWEAYASVLGAMGSEPGVETVAPLTRRGHLPRFKGRYPSDGSGFERSDWFDTASVATWALRAIRAPLAWGCETGTYTADRVRVGVVELRFDTTIADLRPSDPKLFAVSAVLGDTALPEPILRVHERHASAVAALVTAHGDDSAGMAGVMWRTDLRLYALGSLNGLLVEDMATAFVNEILPRLAAEQPRVFNLSVQFGMQKGLTSEMGMLRRALRTFFSASPRTLIVTGTGNEDSVYTPREFIERQGDFVALDAALASLMTQGFRDRVLLVTGTERGNTRWRVTGRPGGANVVRGLTEIAAPAESVGSLGAERFGEGLMLVDGTSFASPLVTGVAAQLWAMDPTLTPAAVKAYIMNGARVPRVSPATGALEGPARVADTGGEEVYQLDAYGALSLLSRERADAPICGLPVSAQFDPEPVGVRIGTRPVRPIPNVLAVTSVAQGGRLIALQVLGDTASEVRILNQHGDSVATLPPNVLERQYLERDTADLVAGSVQLPNGQFVPELEVHRHDGRDTTIQVFSNIAPHVTSMATAVAVSPAGDAAATAWFYLSGPIQSPTEVLRWELVALPSGQVTTVLNATAACGIDVPVPSTSRPAWSHDGRRVVFPIIRVDVDQDCGTTDVRTQLAGFFQGQPTNVVVQDREIVHPRFSPDDVVLHTHERILFDGCRATRRSPANLDPPLADSTADCGVLFQPPELLPNIRLRPPAVIAAADAARVTGFTRARSTIVQRRSGTVQAN